MIQAAYVHIPFCEHICYYCDFNKVFLKNQPVDEYIDALLLEMDRTMREQPTDRLKTVYIGGGTPTALTAEQLTVLLKGMAKILPLDDVLEYTIEVNPDSIEEDKLVVLKEFGINRLSMGVQTFDDELLKEIGRTHTNQSVEQAIERCRRVGLDNISIDLMFGLPKQDPNHFRDTIDRAIQLGVEHISAYSLKIEEKTVFFNRQRKGKLTLPPEDDEVMMYQDLLKLTADAGLIQYEISNFAKKGYESKHNLYYWNNEGYYGFGAGAHGYIDGYRHQNHGPIPKYLQAINDKIAPILTKHQVTKIEQIEEEMFMGLRKREGVNKTAFSKKYGITMDKCFSTQIKELEKRGLLRQVDDQVQLTEHGLLLGNEVFEQFIAVLNEENVE
ncbi:radical SAM family heme chaperone HemW [Bacillus suaedae]|uniref:Heme chaperone HemW n=1 Tax=Halalkalibacter suaedae TaxID=2822140 RepID=A0A940WVX3_9BACI|nr:radical SAM family heme chaperone HemW [Bacillus suaedae]MBP3951318.1 oxygen-independent coproporphyrinogen III oxidase [Bacillus suaedae]